MTDYVYLQGSEDVANAGRNISGAAEEMRRAANQFDESSMRLVRSLDELVTRFERVVEQAVELFKEPIVQESPEAKADRIKGFEACFEPLEPE